MKTQAQAILNYVQLKGMVTSRELARRSQPHTYLWLLAEQGKLQQLDRGLYAPANYEFDEKLSYIEVCNRSPRAVICLLSALRFYEFTTQNPFQVWIAIGLRDKSPQINYPSIRVARFSDKALTEGIEKITHCGIELKIYNPAKTVADCCKYRNKIGTDVAIEVLREGWKKKLFTLRELNYYAKICRVQNVIKPYVESII
jgi:predicted transcriptional regulator of viral defense system